MVATSAACFICDYKLGGKSAWGLIGVSMCCLIGGRTFFSKGPTVSCDGRTMYGGCAVFKFDLKGCTAFHLVTGTGVGQWSEVKTYGDGLGDGVRGICSDCNQGQLNALWNWSSAGVDGDGRGAGHRGFNDHCLGVRLPNPILDVACATALGNHVAWGREGHAVGIDEGVDAEIGVDLGLQGMAKCPA